MIGLDTNVIIRYLVQDEPQQSMKANHIIEKAVADEEILIISQITLCEMVWVLESCYALTKKEIIEVLNKILHTHQIRIEQDDVVRHALRDFSHFDNVDFSDCLIGRQNISKGCSFTYTFDKNAAKKLNSLFKLA